ncbi:hypothetical protein PM082_023313 [Marasmius tenuissimus]|nr:hypothetical protein PM082_023313 [Marasmius tenuissimus]
MSTPPSLSTNTCRCPSSLSFRYPRSRFSRTYYMARTYYMESVGVRAVEEEKWAGGASVATWESVFGASNIDVEPTLSTTASDLEQSQPLTELLAPFSLSNSVIPFFYAQSLLDTTRIPLRTWNMNVELWPSPPGSRDSNTEHLKLGGNRIHLLRNLVPAAAGDNFVSKLEPPIPSVYLPSRDNHLHDAFGSVEIIHFRRTIDSNTITSGLCTLGHLIVHAHSGSTRVLLAIEARHFVSLKCS